MDDKEYAGARSVERMTQIKRPAPHPEWVLMYRKGIPAAKIAAGAGVAQSVVRYHLAIAAKQEPGLWEEHQAALPMPPPRVTDAGRRNLADVLAFYEAEARLPVNGRSPQESALAGWLTRRRQEAAEGSLSPVYAQALDTIPGWRDYPTKRDADAAPLAAASGRGRRLAGLRPRLAPAQQDRGPGGTHPGNVSAHPAHRCPGREAHCGQGEAVERRHPWLAAGPSAAGLQQIPRGLARRGGSSHTDGFRGRQ